MQDGVRLHRLIDGFTDRHPVVRGSIGRIAEQCGWFSGIVIDVYYDHILARDWARTRSNHCESSPTGAYACSNDCSRYAPDRGGRVHPPDIEDDRLVRYATAEGIEDTLARSRGGSRGASRRTRSQLELPCPTCWRRTPTSRPTSTPSTRN